MSAVFSPCRTWRYTLTRGPWRPGAYLDGHSKSVGGEWVPLRTVTFIGLNPSTADETVDDPTVRRCVGYARSWGFERMVMLNAFAYRATNPKRLLALDFETAVGPENDRYIIQEAKKADLVVCAWGVHAAKWHRGKGIALGLSSGGVELHALGVTKDGHPKHPLYLRADLEPVPWS